MGGIMGASVKEEQLEIIENMIEFSKRVGMIDFAEEIEPLGFRFSSVSATFGRDKIDALMSFCRANPEYHIVTQIAPYVYQNKYVPNHFPYFIANGDANPNLLFHPYLRSSFELFHEDIQQKLATKIAEIYRSNNGKPLF
jgi:hypothetical protein